MALVTLAEAKLHLGINDASEDNRIQQILSGIEAWVKDRAKSNGLILEQTAISEMLDGEESARLFLSYRPAVEVTNVWVSDIQDWTDPNKLAVTAYRLYARMGLLKATTGYVWPEGQQNVRVDYKAGDTVPSAGLKMAIIQSCAFVKGQAGKEGIDSERIGDYSYTLSKLEAEYSPVAKMLEPYIGCTVVR